MSTKCERLSGCFPSFELDMFVCFLLLWICIHFIKTKGQSAPKAVHSRVAGGLRRVATKGRGAGTPRPPSLCRFFPLSQSLLFQFHRNLRGPPATQANSPKRIQTVAKWLNVTLTTVAEQTPPSGPSQQPVGHASSSPLSWFKILPPLPSAYPWSSSSGQCPVMPKKLPKRLNFAYMWARTRIVQRALMVRETSIHIMWRVTS